MFTRGRIATFAAVTLTGHICCLGGGSLKAQDLQGAARAAAIWKRAAEAIRPKGVTRAPRKIVIHGRHFTPASPTTGLAVEVRLESDRFDWLEQRTGGDMLEFVTTATETTRVRGLEGFPPVGAVGHRTLRERWAEYAIVYTATLPAACAFTLTYAGRSIRNGAVAEGIDIASPCTGPLRAWFDVTSFRLQALESQRVVVSASIPPVSGGADAVGLPQIARQPVSSVLSVSDFREIAGFMLACRLTRVVTAFTDTLEVASVEVER
jgi:hypothetical protein